jgi:hypothetical protein
MLLKISLIVEIPEGLGIQETAEELHNTDITGLNNCSELKKVKLSL